MFSFVFKKKPPKNVSSKSKFFYKKKVFINWFIQTQFLVIIGTEWENIEPLKIKKFLILLKTRLF